MSIAIKVKKKIEKLGDGVIITYADFGEFNNFQAVALSLSRLCKSGALQRLSKGQYYVPKKTKFGSLMPSEGQILDNLIQRNGGYVAGISALNEMGVTTQIPSEITILGSRSSRKCQVGNLRVKFVRSDGISITPQESKLSNILETIRLFKQIPDSNSDLTLQRLQQCLQGLSKAELKRLKMLSLQFRPAVRALLGALLQNLQLPYWKELEKGLNPISSYKFGLTDEQLPNRSEWRIQ